MAGNSFLCVLAIVAYSTGAVIVESEGKNETYGIHKPFSIASDTLPAPYIYRGDDAEVGAFPWTVRLILRETRTTGSLCGGSLISDRHVLTAAHCMMDSHLRHYHDVYIYLGEYNTTSYGKDCAKGKCVYNRLVYPDKIIRHPQYNSSGNGNNDIALLRLEQRIRPTPSIQPIAMVPFDVDTPAFVDSDLVVAGWGNISTGYPTILQASAMQLAPKNQCRLRILPNGVPPSSFCLKTEIKTVNACNGDSGGPAMVYYRNKYYLAGVASKAPDCGKPGYTTFANVFRHLKWIKSHMK